MAPSAFWLSDIHTTDTLDSAVSSVSRLHWVMVWGYGLSVDIEGERDVVSEIYGAWQRKMRFGSI